jgi:hypothetical protein
MYGLATIKEINKRRTLIFNSIKETLNMFNKAYLERDNTGRSKRAGVW